MSLGDDVRAALPGFRAAAESLMTDTAEVYGLPTKVWDEDTSEYTTTTPKVYTGRCRFKLRDVQNRDVDAQSQALLVQTSVVSFPVADDTVFPKNFTIKLTGSETDPALVGKTVRITGPHAQSYASARRYPVEEVS